MRNIHCPKDIELNNIFIGEDCKEETGEFMIQKYQLVARQT